MNLISPELSTNFVPRTPPVSRLSHGLAVLLALTVFWAAPHAMSQQALGLEPPQATGPNAQSFQGSVVSGQATGSVIDLSLDDAIQRGLKHNLGVILSGTPPRASDFPTFPR